MYILGINAYHGDAAAAIVKDGQLIAAVEERGENFGFRIAEFGFKSKGQSAKGQGPGTEVRDRETAKANLETCIMLS